MNLQIPLARKLPYKFEGVDILLRDGAIVENIAVDSEGNLLGRIVGGHDGIGESSIDFEQDDVVAYRFRRGNRNWHDV